MAVMNIANLSFAAGPEGLLPAVASLEEKLGAKFKDGGFHPRFGTRNHVLPLTHSQYLEVVEVLEHPAADKAPFGQAVRARTAMGGGWMAWVMEPDLSTRIAVERRIFPAAETRAWWTASSCCRKSSLPACSAARRAR